MRHEEVSRRPRLTRIISRHIAAAAAIAITVQTLVTLYENFYEEHYFARHYVNLESAKILGGARFENGRLLIEVEDRAPYYYDENSYAYAFRVFDPTVGIVAQRNGQILESVSPFQGDFTRVPQGYILDIEDGRRFHFAGGRLRKVGDRDVWIELAMVGDPAWVAVGVLSRELLQDVAVPLVPLTLLAMAFAAISVHQRLKPLQRAALQADSIAVNDPDSRLDLIGLPREAASFALAINHLLDRAVELVRLQREFIARAAHELQTPLAILMLEAGRIPGGGARRIEADVAEMSANVQRLLALARVDAMAGHVSIRIDLVPIAQHAVDQLRRLAETRSSRIIIEVMEPEPFEGDPVSLQEALRNLIENGVKHTRFGSTVKVTCGPGRYVLVEDDGDGVAEADLDSLFKAFWKGRQAQDGAGLGLAIVRRAVDMHKGSIEVGRSLMGGLRVSLKFG
jgi:signal transduction histidine kinase